MNFLVLQESKKRHVLGKWYRFLALKPQKTGRELQKT